MFTTEEQNLIDTINYRRIVNPNQSRKALFIELTKEFDERLIKSTLMKLQINQLVTDDLNRKS